MAFQWHGATHGELPFCKHHVRRSVPHVGTFQLKEMVLATLRVKPDP